MIIQTKRLILKPIVADNVTAVAEILAKPAINKWIEPLRNKDINYIKSALEEYYQPEGLNYYAAIYKDDKVIGIVSLEKEEDQFYYIDIYLDPSVHRQGYATEVICEGLFKYIEQNLEIKKISARIATQNIQSNALANKLKSQAKSLDIEVKINQMSLPFWTNDPKKYVAYGITAFTFGLGLFCLFKYSNVRVIPEKIKNLITRQSF